MEVYDYNFHKDPVDPSLEFESIDVTDIVIKLLSRIYIFTEIIINFYQLENQLYLHLQLIFVIVE